MKIINEDEIPIIEPDKEGYWEIYKNKKIWHQENMKLQDLYNKEREIRKSKSNFISLEDGESFEGEFVGVEKIVGQFGEVNSYTFLVDGQEKKLNSKSFKLLRKMVEAGVEEGDMVRITKTGKRFSTDYEVEKLEQ